MDRREEIYAEHQHAMPHRRQHKPQHNQRQRPRSSGLSNEYEYVRKEYGFDYMPPSRYVPSMSGDTDEYSDADPPGKIEMPDSDLTGSIEVEYEDFHGSQPKATPVVWGKTIKISSSQPTSRKKRVMGAHDDHQTKHRLQMKRLSEEFKRKKHQMPKYRASPDHHHGRKRRDSEHFNPHAEEKPSYKPFKGHPSNLIMDVPSAYSYNSESSREMIRTPKEVRYSRDDQGKFYGANVTSFPSPESRSQHRPYHHGWTPRSPRDIMVPDYSEALKEKSTPKIDIYPHRSAKPKFVREHRSEKPNEKYWRMSGHETRDPPPAKVYAETLFCMHPTKQQNRRREYHLSDTIPIDNYAKPTRYYDDPSMDERRVPAKQNLKQNNHVKREKKKSKGIFGRLIGNVRGDRAKTDSVDVVREWKYSQGFDSGMSIYGPGPGSSETDITPYPPHQHNIANDDARYTHEHDSEEFDARRKLSSRPTRRSTSPRQPPTTLYEPPTCQSRSHHHAVFTEPPNRPFSEAYPSIPLVTRPELGRRNGITRNDRRRFSHDHGAGLRNMDPRESNSPRTLNFDGTQVRVTQKVSPRTNILGCY